MTNHIEHAEHAEHAVIHAVEHERLQISDQIARGRRNFLAVQRVWNRRWFYASALMCGEGETGVPMEVFIEAFRNCYTWFDLQDRDV